MYTLSIELIETIAVVVVMILIHVISNNAINRTLKRFNFTLKRRRIITKLINFIVVILSIIAIVAIWGIEQSELFLFLSSVVTVIGIAFFAQWSLLSNMTSALILFFNHPIKLGDTIEIHDKDYPLQGVVKDIGYYFVLIETEDKQVITIPNSIFLQKMVSVKVNRKTPEKSS
ncbi:MAG: mechanosensitive ion channel family protein [Salibacteraceae bacterium]